MKLRLFAFCLSLFTLALAASAQSPYISRVFEYVPAPGQFVNMIPEWEEGDEAEDMRRKAEESIANHNNQMITLGAWGGYVTFGFDHMVKNLRGRYDFKIVGNSVYSTSAWSDSTRVGGSAEPGIVMVSYDANGNGEPDDEWYELAGSEYRNPATRHDYACTYYRPAADHVAVADPEDKFITDTAYVYWTDNYEGAGYVNKISFHRQNYYPNWIEADAMTFNGTRLPDNGVDERAQGNNFVLYCYDWGYADNHPNYSKYEQGDESVPEYLRHVSEFKIDWAVDGKGKRVWLPGIHFVKVYTAVNQFNGWIGEESTEVQDAWDLHMLDAQGKAVTEEEEEEDPSPYDMDGDGWLTIDDIRELMRIYLEKK